MIDEILVYINNHLGSKITLERLAGVTGYSPFYLHRQFTAGLGVSLGKYVQQQRLHTAAYFLALTNIPLDDVKYLVGFEDSSAFGRAFKSRYGVSPLQYRKSKAHQQAVPVQTFRYISTEGTLVKGPAKKARVFTSSGDYFSAGIFAVWAEVARYIAAAGKHPDDFEHYAILYECPHVTGNKESRYDAAIVPRGFDLPSEPFLQTMILEGRYVRFNFCSKVQDYASVSVEVNASLAGHPRLQHRHGASYFRFDRMPDPAHPDNLFIHWYLPVS